MPGAVRILFLADTHLGFDLPVRPRVERRRRGHDFLANYARALAPALGGEVDAVVHGGDVFDRPSVIGTVAWQAFEPLRQVADRGVPVFIVPGNHERSRLPHLRFAVHPRIHVFDRPRTFVLEAQGQRVAISGFPYERRDVRTRFARLVTESNWSAVEAGTRLLCMHHCAEGATVGPQDYRFTTADDVVRHADVPPAFAAVLTGHIHRHQVLTRDLQGRRIAVPVLYPGSIERTSVAEVGEPKGFLTLELPGDGAPMRWTFHELPARPMLRATLPAGDVTAAALHEGLRALVDGAPEDAVLAVRLEGSVTAEQRALLTAARLRALIPPTMNLEVRVDQDFQRPERVRSRGHLPPEPQLDLLDAP